MERTTLNQQFRGLVLHNDSEEQSDNRVRRNSGRPKLYNTEEERRVARRKQQNESKRRNKLLKQQKGVSFRSLS